MADTAEMKHDFTHKMSGPVGSLVRLHRSVFSTIEEALAGWFNGFVARFAFASVLLVYYLNSASNKLGDGLLGFLHPSIGAYASIIPPVFDRYGNTVEDVPFFPWDLIVIVGTLGELVLPILVVVGLFSRIAAIGMIVFVVVQSFVDVMYFEVTGKYLGAMFDRFPDAIIFDQRLLWIFVLLMIVVNGPGKLSLDYLLRRRFG